MEIFLRIKDYSGLRPYDPQSWSFIETTLLRVKLGIVERNHKTRYLYYLVLTVRVKFTSHSSVVIQVLSYQVTGKVYVYSTSINVNRKVDIKS